MKKFTTILMSAAMLTSTLGAQAGNLWIIGDATNYGWSLDDATALLSTPATPDIYTGTIYLKADQDFKFMTTTDWSNDEWGSAEGATLTDGEIPLAMGKEDTGYGKIKVTENGNYMITVNLEEKKATIVKSDYQETEINLCSLFMVGDPTPGGWSVDQGTPLYQNQEAPYEYKSEAITLNEGTFKIATVIKGGGTWDAKYWYYKDVNDPDKMVLGQDGDEQWSIAKSGSYIVSVNLLDLSISIKDDDVNAIVDSIIDEPEAPVVYYNLHGTKVENPHDGVFIRVAGNQRSKVMIGK